MDLKTKKYTFYRFFLEVPPQYGRTTGQLCWIFHFSGREHFYKHNYPITLHDNTGGRTYDCQCLLSQVVDLITTG